MVDALTAEHMRRVANAPAATHITQRAGTAKQMNWPHDDNAAWDRAHPAEAAQARLEAAHAESLALMWMPWLWPLATLGMITRRKP